MPSLREIQSGFRDAILGIDDHALDAFVVADGIASADRIAIHRNTYLGTLVRALRLNYPAIERLVGAPFFEAAAHAYVARHPPRSAWLDRFGEHFASFLADFEPAAGVPYLPDIAALEWRVANALHAEDFVAVDLDALAALTQDEKAGVAFVAQPSASLIRTVLPVDAIWRAVVASDDAAMAAIDLADGPRWYLVRRARDDTVEVEALSESDGRFVADLLEGRTLQDALDRAHGVDVSPLLAHLLAHGVFSRFRLADARTEGASKERVA